MSWRYAFIQRFGPGGLSGATLGVWLKALAANRFKVAPRHWPRAAVITFNSLLNTPAAWWERLRYGRSIERVTVPPPLFVIGSWRSGTTHLHNLLARDRRFAWPTTFETFFPHTFLSTAKLGAALMQWFTPSTRPMDNMKYSVEEPQEDEFALASAGLSFMLGLLMFPQTGEHYQRYLTLRDASDDERAAWENALLTFVRKLMWKDSRPLVLKSPGHTGRIATLLKLFPDAKFVHIHRHPCTVFQSTVHTWRKVHQWWALQPEVAMEERVIANYRELYDAFFEQRGMIRDGHYCEVRFDDLERDPLGEVRRVYETLSLPAFEETEPVLREYIASLAGYRKNKHDDLPGEMRDRLSREWRRCFEEWGYKT